jgi:hypothetical protein
MTAIVPIEVVVAQSGGKRLTVSARAVSGRELPIQRVIAGLDPAIHQFKDSRQEDECAGQARA